MATPAGSASLLTPTTSTCFVWDRGHQHVPDAIFMQLVSDEGLRETRAGQFAVEDRVDLRPVGELVFARRGHDFEELVLRTPDSVVHANIGRHGVGLTVAAVDRERVDAAFDSVVEALPIATRDADLTSFGFWANGQHDVQFEMRPLTTPSWDEIRPDQPIATSSCLDALMGAVKPELGRLVLWHGPPGTGKTHALQALAREWRDWCAVHFITDPENFLGDTTAYLLSVLASGDVDHKLDRDWKLIILEDAGELLAADARARTGQALSRLLNVTDGLLGQGMKAIVLVTTNEELGKLHPAVTRKGRCWMDVAFTELPRDEANAWLEAHGSTARVTRATPLADLYALLAGRELAESVSVGFAGFG